jgi:hypothetical protein
MMMVAYSSAASAHAKWPGPLINASFCSKSMTSRRVWRYRANRRIFMVPKYWNEPVPLEGTTSQWGISSKRKRAEVPGNKQEGSELRARHPHSA